MSSKALPVRRNETNHSGVTGWGVYPLSTTNTRRRRKKFVRRERTGDLGTNRTSPFSSPCSAGVGTRPEPAEQHKR